MTLSDIQDIMSVFIVSFHNARLFSSFGNPIELHKLRKARVDGGSQAHRFRVHLGYYILFNSEKKSMLGGGKTLSKIPRHK